MITLHSNTETANTTDVVMSRNAGAVNWPRFFILAMDHRPAAWLDDELEAYQKAYDMAKHSNGRVICRF